MTNQPDNQTGIFQAAVNLPADQRDQFLAQACGDNQPLRHEIESLLRAHDPESSFLQAPALAATLEQPRVTQTIDEQPGSMIGPYKIREKVGEGGFGVVYVAEQEQPVRRKVALKVIKPGMDSREIVARFEAERQALALMDHPHIAKILDASTTASGRPYFVMELVRGVPITDYCNAHKLPTKQRLQLFIQVCHAVQHAHQKGVVHRDLKPSNVLVAPHDGVPVVKVIDFGVAKALGQQLTDKSIYTRFASMIGTPLYMSPEQAEINALDVDTRSDVYSLGVLLYELLTGTTPFDRKKLESAAFDEMRRIIREETPESPSSRLTTMASAQKAIAANHGIDSGNLARIIRGDLDVIVMKALEKERGRRYDTASAFAEDVGRFLNQEAILAKPASTAYRFKKFAQRNQGAMLTGTLIAATLFLATIASTWSAITASRSRNEALASAAEAIEARRQAERSAQDARTAEQAEMLRAEEARQAKAMTEAAEQRLRLQLYVSDCSQAFRAAEVGNFDLMHELLERHRPKGDQLDMRGSEWYYLRRQCDDSRKTPTFNHGGPISSVAISPDGMRQATVGFDGTVVVWDCTTKNKIATFDVSVRSEAGLATSTRNSFVSFSQDSQSIVAIVNGQLWRWNISADDQEPTPVSLTMRKILAASFSPDVTLLALVVDGSSGIFLYDTATGRLVKKFSTPVDELAQRAVLAFSPDGEFLASSRGSQNYVWDLAEYKLCFTLENEGWKWTYGLALSEGGKILAKASGGPPHSVEVWDLITNREIARFQDPTEHLRSLAISPDGSFLAGGGDEAKVYVWDISTVKQFAVFKGHGGAIADLIFSPDGSQVTTAAIDGLACRWDLRAEGKDSFGTSGSYYPIGLAASSDGKTLRVETMAKNRSVAKQREVTFWDTGSGQPTPESEARWNRNTPASSVRPFDVRTVGTSVELRDTESGERVALLKGHRRPIRTWHFAPDGRTLATGAGTQIKLWNLATFQEIGTLMIDTNIYKLTYLPDGTLVSADDYSEIRLWRTTPRNKEAER